MKYDNHWPYQSEGWSFQINDLYSLGLLVIGQEKEKGFTR
jgi:hypothetical protein